MVIPLYSLDGDLVLVRALGTPWMDKACTGEHLEAKLVLSADKEDISKLSILRNPGQASSLVLGSYWSI